MASLLNGLSSAGAGLAGFAATYGAEQQRADVAKQLQEGQQAGAMALQSNAQQFQSGLLTQKDELDRKAAILADSLATQRGLTLQGSAGQIASTAADKQQAFELQKQREQATLLANAPSPEIKSAEQFSRLGPEAKRAYREEMMTKAGLPPWMIGDDQAGGPAPLTSGSAAPTGASTTAVTDGASTPAAPVTGTTTSSRPGLNEDALTKLPPTAQSLVKGMVDGRITPPSSFAASKPYWQNLIQMATTYDPTFDETTWAGRVAARKDMASGKSAQAITALNTALSHAGTLVDDFDKLGNLGGIGTPLNAPLNYANQFFGGSTLTKATETRDALASEARKVFAAAGGGNLSELQEWQKNFPLNGSPAQQKAALSGFVDLLDGRLQALADQYNRAMGRTDDPITFLQPKARAAYEKLTGREPPTDAVGYQTGKPPAGAAPSGAAPASALDATPPPAPAATIPAWVKPGDQYSPSRGMARGADGKVYGPP